MSWFPRPVGPRAAFADLRAFIRQREREHWIRGALAVLVTIIIIVEFFVDSKINTAPPPRVVYVQTYAAERSDADIVASQKRDQAKRKADKKEHQRQMQELQERLGIE